MQGQKIKNRKETKPNEDATPHATNTRTVVTPGGGGVLPYMGYIGMCGPKGYGFSAVLVINRVSILADFGHFGHK